jgi:hypothetical protein
MLGRKQGFLSTNVIISLSFAKMIFPGPLPQYQGMGCRMHGNGFDRHAGSFQKAKRDSPLKLNP